MAIQLVSRARDAGLAVTVREVFAERTVAGLAAAASAHRPGGDGLAPNGPLVELDPTDLDEIEAAEGGPVEVLPLSPLQEGLYFHAAFDDGASDVYVQQQAIDLTGPLDAGALRAAAGALLERHPNLRARFHQCADGTPVQVIGGPVPAPWREADLTGLPEDERDRRADAIAADERDRRFPLDTAPLVRFALLRLEAAPIGAAGAQRPGAEGAKSGDAASFDLSAALAAEKATVTYPRAL
jgi:hypothetical protein